MINSCERKNVRATIFAGTIDECARTVGALQWKSAQLICSMCICRLCQSIACTWRSASKWPLLSIFNGRCWFCNAFSVCCDYEIEHSWKLVYKLTVYDASIESCNGAIIKIVTLQTVRMLHRLEYVFELSTKWIVRKVKSFSWRSFQYIQSLVFRHTFERVILHFQQNVV